MLFVDMFTKYIVNEREVESVVGELNEDIE